MGRARLVFRSGDTLTRTIDWDAPSGDAIDLTGYVITAEVTVGEVSFELDESDGLVVDDDEGRITLTLDHTQTDDFEEKFGTWRLVATSYSDERTTLAEGLVFVDFG